MESGTAGRGSAGGDDGSSGRHVLEHSLETSLSTVDPRVRGRVLEWARRLIDLSRRNRLLAYRVYKRTSLEFRSPSPDEIAERLLANARWMFYEPPVTEGETAPPPLETLIATYPPSPFEVVTTHRSRDELSRSLDAIARRSKAEFEDRGLPALYFVWNLVQWTDPESVDEWMAPLIMLPVVLTRESARDRYVLQRTDDDAVVNPALRVKLENDFGVHLPDIDVEDTALSDIRRLIEASIRPRIGTWRIEAHSGVGLFSFHKEAIYRDLVTNADAIASHPAVQSFALGQLVPALLPNVAVDLPSEAELDRAQNPAESLSVLDADSSQRIAIEAAVRGQSHVIQGPPGTGKSQTIANMIAELVGRGKSVLFVSEKMAALEVVANRLHEAELGDLLLELHSHKAKRQEVARELGRTLGQALEVNDGDFDRVAQRVGDLREQLNDYVDALHATVEPLGRSVFDVLAELEGLVLAPALPSSPVEPGSATIEDLDAFLALSDVVSGAWDPVDNSDFPWQGAAPVPWEPAIRQQAVQVFSDMQHALEELQAIEDGIVGAVAFQDPKSPDDRARLLSFGDLAARRQAVPMEWLTSDDLAPLSALIETWESQMRRRASSVDGLSENYGSRWTEIDPTLSGDLSSVFEAVARVTGCRVKSWDRGAIDTLGAAASSIGRHTDRIAGISAELRALLGVGGGSSLKDIDDLLTLARLTQKKIDPSLGGCPEAASTS